MVQGPAVEEPHASLNDDAREAMANAEARSLVERTLLEHGSAQAAIEEFERRDHVR